MRFERLSIGNLGVFRGEHSIDLSMTDSARPIVLVGALNGSGKTTLIEVLQLALYGKRAAFSWRGAPSYQQYLEQIRNRHSSLTDPMTAEVTMRLADGRRVRVKRQWMFNKAQPKEYISVFLNDSAAPDLLLSESWEEEIERLLPARLSELFFFDGERIERLANPAQSADVLRSAVASLLGLDLVDHLCADLAILRARQKQKMLTPADQLRLEGVNTQIAEASRSREDLMQQRAACMSQLDRAKLEKVAADRRFREQGGDRFAQREELAHEAASERGRYRALETQVRQLAAGVLPLQLAAPLLANMHEESADKLLSHDESAVVALKRHLEDFEAWVRGRSFSAAVKSDLLEYAASARKPLKSLPAADGLPWDRISGRLEGLRNGALPDAIDTATTVLSELADSGERLARVEAQLAKVPAQEQLAEALRAQGAAEAHLVAVSVEISQCEEQIQRHDRLLHSLRQQREEVLERNAEAGDASRISDYCQRASKSLQRFREQLVRKRRQQLEALILEAFQLLVRKPDLVGRIALDSETMAVSLFTPEGLPLLTTQLSAGERQLLAVAMLWGLARASGRPVPVVIDTPLGRLDGEHRKTLVERYFPGASHQVILLSTDKEVDAQFSEILDNSVAHRYLIGYDDAKRSSSFSSGYFDS